MRIRRKKRRKRRKRIARGGGLVKIEAPVEQRKKFPKKLINAYLNLEKIQWTEEAYAFYAEEAKKYLGDNINDRIASGR